MEEGDDITNYLARWQENRAPFQSDDPQAQPPEHYVPDNSMWVDADSPGPMPAPVMAAAQAGPTGDKGTAGSRGLRGSQGAQGPSGNRGTVGSRGSRGSRGTAGLPGTPGLPGPTGPKESIVRTERGNIAFACFEGAQPRLSDTYLGLMAGRTRLRANFVASVVPGTLRVFSVVSDVACGIGGRIEGDELVLEHDHPSELDAPHFDVTVAGIHRHFPDWDMPQKSDEECRHSWNFWGKEHR